MPYWVMADGQLTDLHELAKRNRYGNLTTNLAFSQNCHAHTSAVESEYPTTLPKCHGFWRWRREGWTNPSLTRVRLPRLLYHQGMTVHLTK